MKKQKLKTINKIFNILIISSFIFFFTLAITANTTKAANDKATGFLPSVSIPGSDFQAGQQFVLSERSTKYIGQYISAFYDYSMAIVGIVAVIVLMIGGVIWLTSAGNPSKISQAKDLIIGSITGVALLLVSWIMLNTINPDLIRFKVSTIEYIEEIVQGCCQYNDKAEITNNKKCEAGGGQFLTKVSDKLRGDRYYSLADNGKKCSLPGCCVTKTSGGQVTSCADTMSHNCPSATFYQDPCTYVSSLGIGCPQKDICQKEDTKNGDKCFEKDGYGVCHCYDGVAWYNNQGKKGEPCGNHGNSTCTTEGGFDYTGYYCTGSNMWHDMLGRRCGKGLWCCYEE